MGSRNTGNGFKLTKVNQHLPSGSKQVTVCAVLYGEYGEYGEVLSFHIQESVGEMGGGGGSTSALWQ